MDPRRPDLPGWDWDRFVLFTCQWLGDLSIQNRVHKPDGAGVDGPPTNPSNQQLPPQHLPECRSGQGQLLSPLDQLRLLLIRLSEHWPNYRVFDWQNDVPWTNNGTEQVIGRMKIRSRTVRGYKSKAGLLAGLLVAGSSVC